MDEERYNLTSTSTKLVLKSINLNNFATFNDQTINFSKNFNSIIGETGSGKSLILDALQLILGARADRKLVRKDSEYATIEAVFECDDEQVKKFFDSIGFPYDQNEVIIKRIIYTNGKSKSYLNFQLCNLQTLHAFSKRFIDIVGQFENQKLLTSNYQLVLLDNYTGHDQLLFEYQNYFDSLSETKNNINKVMSDHATRAQRIDYINYQISELAKLDPNAQTEKNLINKKEKISNIEQSKLLYNSIEYIFNNEAGLFSNLSRLEKEISHNINLINDKSKDKFYAAKDLLSELSYEIASQMQTDFDEQELNETIEHLDFYQKLKRKFGTDTEGLIEIYQDFLKEKESLENHEMQLESLLKKEKELEGMCFELAEKLHQNRIKSAKKLSSNLSKVIQNLNMVEAKLDIQIKRTEQLSKAGLTEITFLAETNPGEGFYKVKEIASGGELSRILLALRQVLSSKDSISVFFFDEIDSGIGGETGLKIGSALKEVSFNSQVIAITHLPQIANYSDKLIVVSKKLYELEGKKRTHSTVLEVNDEQIKSHVNRMTPLN